MPEDSKLNEEEKGEEPESIITKGKLEPPQGEP